VEFIARAVYRQCAVAYTDFWDAYGAVFPNKRHKAVGKETGKTSYIERFNCTMRQRVSRLVSSSLALIQKGQVCQAYSSTLA
jgi:IS1 family transposase